jgi:hypothetical protein
MHGEGRGLHRNAERGDESADEMQRSAAAEFHRVPMLRGRPLTPVAALLVLALWLASPAARAGSAAEVSIGTSCSTGNNSIDWDTVSQCNGTVFAHGPLILGAMTHPPYSATTCSSSNAGMIQWTGSVMEYCDGTNWDTLAMIGGGTCSSRAAFPSPI